MSDNKRIKKAINWLISQGIISSQKELGEYLGITNKSYLSQLVNSDSPNREFVNKFIAIAPMISSSWLLMGEGEMLKANDNENEEQVPENNGKFESRIIPFYDVETTGGYHGRVTSSNVDATLAGYINAGDWFQGRETAAIRHVGDSMIEYPDGCILAVREVREMRLLVPGRNYVIETDEYRVTKRVQRGSTTETIALYSSNEEKYSDGRLVHEPFEVNIHDIRRVFSVLGYIVNQSGEPRLIRP